MKLPEMMGNRLNIAIWDLQGQLALDSRSATDSVGLDSIFLIRLAGSENAQEGRKAPP